MLPYASRVLTLSLLLSFPPINFPSAHHPPNNSVKSSRVLHWNVCEVTVSLFHSLGMFATSEDSALNIWVVKSLSFIRYGNRICLSETVDSKVAPVWTNEESLYLAHAERAPTSTVTSRGTLFAQRQSSYQAGRITDFADIAEAVNPARAWFRPRENDLVRARCDLDTRQLSLLSPCL